MATNYPTSLQDLDASRGTTGQPLSTPNHITHHTTEDDTIEALQAKLGANSSAVTTSHDYKLGGVTASDKAVSLTGTETLTNKTLTSPSLTTPSITNPTLLITSHATGDIYYDGGSGVLTRLAVSTDGKILKLASGIPSWATETVTNDASTTVKGIAEEATLAEIDANTAAGGTSARLFVNPSTLGKSVDTTLADDSDAKIPSQHAVKTYVDTQIGLKPHNWKVGSTTYDASTASGTQNIAHGLGRTPVFVRITITENNVISNAAGWSFGVYDGSTSVCQWHGKTGAFVFGMTASVMVYYSDDGGTQTATITVDGTNIVLSWTKAASPTGTLNLMWEVY